MATAWLSPEAGDRPSIESVRVSRSRASSRYFLSRLTVWLMSFSRISTPMTCPWPSRMGATSWRTTRSSWVTAFRSRTTMPVRKAW